MAEGIQVEGHRKSILLQDYQLQEHQRGFPEECRESARRSAGSRWRYPGMAGPGLGGLPGMGGCRVWVGVCLVWVEEEELLHSNAGCIRSQ